MEIRYITEGNAPYDIYLCTDDASTDPYSSIEDFLATNKVDHESPNTEDVTVSIDDSDATKLETVTWYGNIGIVGRVVLERRLGGSLKNINLTVIFDGPGFYIIQPPDGHQITMRHARRGEEPPIIRVRANGENGAHELQNEAEGAIFYCGLTGDQDASSLPSGNYFVTRVTEDATRRLRSGHPLRRG